MAARGGGTRRVRHDLRRRDRALLAIARAHAGREARRHQTDRATPRPRRRLRAVRAPGAIRRNGAPRGGDRCHLARRRSVRTRFPGIPLERRRNRDGHRVPGALRGERHPGPDRGPAQTEPHPHPRAPRTRDPALAHGARPTPSHADRTIRLPRAARGARVDGPGRGARERGGGRARGKPDGRRGGHDRVDHRSRPRHG